MTLSKHVFRASAALTLALSLASCGPSDKAVTAANYCPAPFKVQDTQTLTRFAPGATEDARNVVFQAALGDIGYACKLGKNQLDVNVTLQVGVTAGAANRGGTVSVPYFVRVLGINNAVMQGREFNADFQLSASHPRGVSAEQLTLHLPFAELPDLINYRIAVGLKPTPEELNYTRRAAGGGAR
jgi:hypothetical protein